MVCNYCQRYFNCYGILQQKASEFQKVTIFLYDRFNKNKFSN